MSADEARLLVQAMLMRGGKVASSGGSHTAMNCCLHDDKQASMSVNNETGQWKCHGCGAQGNYKTFMKEYGHEVSTEEAPPVNFDPPQVKPKAPRVYYSLPKHDRLFHYKHADGTDAFTIVRREGSGPFKHRPMIKTGEGWIMGLPKDGSMRPIYRLPEVLGSDESPVVIVEGEKCVEALIESGILKTSTVTTWQGGAKGWAKTDFSVLKDRKVYLISDGDTVGRTCMAQIADHLVDKVGAAKVFLYMAEGEGHDDVADWLEESAGDTDKVRERLKEGLKLYGPWIDRYRQLKKPAAPKKEGDEEKEVKPVKAPSRKYKQELPEFEEGWIENQPYFRIIGRSERGMLIRSMRFRNRAMYILPFTSISKNAMLELAPRTYWVRGDPIPITDLLMQEVASQLIDHANKLPFVSEGRIRGPGAAMDKGRFVFHLGDRLIVEGVETSLETHNFDNVYTEDEPLDWAKPTMDWKKSLGELGEAMMNYKWESDVDGYIFLGWLGTALVSGAMSWRVNPWVCAPSRSGKSWLIDNIIRRLLGEAYIVAVSDPTEASLSYWSGNAGLPIVLDEMSAEKIQKTVLELVKMTSSGGRKRIRADLKKASKVSVIEPRCSFYLSSTEMPRLTEEVSSRLAIIKLANEGLSNEAWGILANRLDDILHGRKAEQMRWGLIDEGPNIVASANQHMKELVGHGYGDREAHQVGVLSAGLELLLPKRDIASLRESLHRRIGDRRAENVSDPAWVLGEILNAHAEGNMTVVYGSYSRDRSVKHRIIEWLVHHKKSGRMVAETMGIKFVRVTAKRQALCVARGHPGLVRLAQLIDRPKTDIYELVKSIAGARQTSRRTTFGGINKDYVIISPETLRQMGYQVNSEGRVVLEVVDDNVDDSELIDDAPKTDWDEK